MITTSGYRFILGVDKQQRSRTKRRECGCVQGWKEKMLSKMGKEFLIKALAQAIPTFAMGSFDLTKGMCDQMSSLIVRF